MTGLILWLKIQEGKGRMRKERFSEELGGTSDCVMRRVTKTFKFRYHISENNQDDNEDMEESKELYLYL